jgi:hypothetical protein
MGLSAYSTDLRLDSSTDPQLESNKDHIQACSMGYRLDIDTHNHNEAEQQYKSALLAVGVRAVQQGQGR